MLDNFCHNLSSEIFCYEMNDKYFGTKGKFTNFCWTPMFETYSKEYSLFFFFLTSNKICCIKCSLIDWSSHTFFSIILDKKFPGMKEKLETLFWSHQALKFILAQFIFWSCGFKLIFCFWIVPNTYNAVNSFKETSKRGFSKTIFAI